jgi:hypothetical protein
MSVEQRVTRIYDECDGVWAQSGVTSYERRFLEDHRHSAMLNDKQEHVLQEIERKVFPPDDEADA